MRSSIILTLNFKTLEYREDNIDAKMSIIFNETMTFPNMTFCMAKNQAWSHFRFNSNETSAKWDSIIDVIC